MSAEVGLVQLIASFKWAALSLEGPAADAAGKDLIAFMTVLVEKTMGGGTGKGGKAGGEASGCSFASLLWAAFTYFSAATC